VHPPHRDFISRSAKKNVWRQCWAWCKCRNKWASAELRPGHYKQILASWRFLKGEPARKIWWNRKRWYNWEDSILKAKKWKNAMPDFTQTIEECLWRLEQHSKIFQKKNFVEKISQNEITLSRSDHLPGKKLFSVTDWARFDAFIVEAASPSAVRVVGFGSVTVARFTCTLSAFEMQANRGSMTLIRGEDSSSTLSETETSDGSCCKNVSDD